MKDGYKIVANTAAGRRRYMQYLIPQVVTADIVDRYDIWVNTTNKEDIAFFKKCAETFPKIRLVWQPDGVVSGISSINAFYRDCCDEDTIYIKLDDDLIWLEPDFFDKMVTFRIEHPEYFVVSPLVINNMLCVYILQAKGKLKLLRKEYFRADCRYKITNGAFAADLHDWFLGKLEHNTWKELHCGTVPWELTRFSINSISWFGADYKKWGGVIPGDDEEFQSCIKPTELGLANGVNGDCLCAHFAFYTQRAYLDKQNILERYGSYMTDQWAENSTMGVTYRKITEILSWINQHREAIKQEPDIYQTSKTSKLSWGKRWKRKIAVWKVPVFRLKTLYEIKTDLRSSHYIKYIDR